MYWLCLSFSELSSKQLYELIKLRIDVFMVEQNCLYPELDDKDHASGVRHLLGYQQNNLVAYARLLPPGISYQQVSIGRIVTAKKSRQNGCGKALLTTVLQQCQQLWPAQDIKIGAQCYLIDFYQSFGFERVSNDYMEDGIAHLDMLLMK
ncbi:GNAT family N-acetyltransferase [Psychromonas antarctica]|jgi:ElaA protein|uniref:GNAT family N-acetyltransferase n=1 Tax=Psychromonas antarctica TaxID=67573 RepID=UPI001EE8E8D8|nr:GNAT family N-acetyltransferase [Psychromonas antarctica]MCG6202069.1 GNAT family N-acetyltransferase [Psychromonas antarctica]